MGPDGLSWAELVDWLSQRGVSYLTGGSAEEALPVDPRVVAMEPEIVIPLLATAEEARLRGALIALLLRKPEYAREAQAMCKRLPKPTRKRLQISVAVAAALQTEWAFSLRVYLPDSPSIAGEWAARQLGLPLPHEDYGQATLSGAAELLRADAPFPFAWERDWEDAVHRLLNQLKKEAGAHGA